MNWLNELRYTLKILGRNFRFTLLCTSIILVGIAIVLPSYALIDNFALRTPALNSGDEYVVLKKRMVPGTRGRDSRYDAFHVQSFRQQATSFKSLHAWHGDMRVAISDGDYTEAFSAAEIEPALLQSVQVQPLLGRLLLPEDTTGAEAPVMLISYEVWQTYYAGRQDIIGHQSRIDGQNRTVVGVMPENFGFPISQQLWLPLADSANVGPGSGPENLSIAGVLADGVDIDEAHQEIALLQAAIIETDSTQYAHIQRSEVLPYTYFNTGGGQVDTGSLLIVLASIVILVTFNIGNLFVARGEERIQELAVRSALGAVPVRVALALLLESFLVCCAGLLTGWACAYFGIAYLADAMSTLGGGVLTEFFWWDMSLNGRMLTVSALTMVFVWLASGGLAAWRISRTDLSELLGSGGKGHGEQGTTRLMKLLVNVQLIVPCVLLTVGYTSFTTSFNDRITTQSNSDNLYTGRFTLNAMRQSDAQVRQSWLDTLQQALLNQPGVTEVAFTSAIPGNGYARISYNIEDQDLQGNETRPQAFGVSVTDNYFDLVDVDILQGRGFGIEDTEGGLPVAIIDQRLADRWWPGESAVGKRMQLSQESNASWHTIVGVAAPSVMEGSLRSGEPGEPVIYQTIRQSMTGAQLSLLLSASNTSFDYLGAIRNAATTADRDTLITDIQSVSAMEQDRADAQDFNRNMVYAVLLIAIYLTAVATYGLAARAVARRRMETGIRMALGASPDACIRLFLRDGCKMVIYGLGIGSMLAIAASWSLLASNGSATDAIRALIPTIAILGFVMGTLVLLANYFPARRLVAMEPTDALRYD